MRLIFLGPPGAGKGTQAGLLAQRHGVTWLASGNILRQALSNHEPLGKEAAHYMEQGMLVPDELITGVILARVGRLGKKESFVLDGFPRTLAQAKELDGYLSAQGQSPVDKVVDFEILEEQVVNRLAGRRVCGKCGANYHVKNLAPKKSGICDQCGSQLIVRPDDEPQTIRKRMQVYHKQTEPLLDFYRSQAKLRAVPGDLEIEAQYQALMKVLKKEQLV